MSIESSLAVPHFQHFQKGVAPLLVAVVSYGKSTVIWILVCQQRMGCFSLVAFKTFILYLVFNKLTMMCLDMSFSGFMVFGVCWSSWNCSLFLFPDFRSFQLLFLQKFFNNILFLLSGTLIIQILELELVSHRLLRLSSLFFPFYLSLLFILGNCIHLSSSWLTLSSVMSILLLSLYCIFHFLTSSISLFKFSIFYIKSRVLVILCVGVFL